MPRHVIHLRVPRLPDVTFMPTATRRARILAVLSTPTGALTAEPVMLEVVRPNEWKGLPRPE